MRISFKQIHIPDLIHAGSETRNASSSGGLDRSAGITSGGKVEICHCNIRQTAKARRVGTSYSGRLPSIGGSTLSAGESGAGGTCRNSHIPNQISKAQIAIMAQYGPPSADVTALRNNRSAGVLQPAVAIPQAYASSV